MSAPFVRPSLVDRALRTIAPVSPGEGLVVLLLLADVFLILCGYYLLKTVREGLVLTSGTFGLRGDDLKLVATGAMAIVLLGAVPAYAALAARVSRIRLLRASYLAVLSGLGAFFVLGRAGVPVGLAFFVWLGIVNMFLVGQFWSVASDLCTEDQGKRLFAAIGIGGSAGAIVGPRLAALTDTWSAMALAALLLAVCLGLYEVIERVTAGSRTAVSARSQPAGTGRGGFALVLGDRYLRLIAILLVAANLVNTIGELILSRAALDHVAGIADAGARREAIKAFYADLYGWVNLLGFVAQALLVSHVMLRVGVRRALFVLPAIAVIGYGAVGLVGGVALVRAAKIVENATDYSLQNTVRQALFLPVGRDAKYAGKNAIDTFFVRGGDLLAALVVLLVTRVLGLDGAALALVNAGIAVAWLAIAGLLARAHAKVTS